MSHGTYLNDDTVDMHAVLVARWRPGTVLAIARAGLFSSTDRGGHWASGRLEALNPKGQTYCRDIREAPGDPKTIWVAAGANFQSDLGALFRRKDGGASWARVKMEVEPKTTMIALAFDQRHPRRMFSATGGGEGVGGADGGESWAVPLAPERARRGVRAPTQRPGGAWAPYGPAEAEARRLRSVPGARTTMRCQGCPSMPLLVSRPASTIRRTTVSGTGLSW